MLGVVIIPMAVGLVVMVVLVSIACRVIDDPGARGYRRPSVDWAALRGRLHLLPRPRLSAWVDVGRLWGRRR